MSKNTKDQVLNNMATDIGRGKIKDNFFAAIVTSKVYKLQVVQAKKGKGSFKRSSKHQGREPYLINA
ncbi:MAG: alternative ribosome rescue factor ArfA [Colwellia sp.]|jgi:alternative ribosome-rescue factor|uniref:alternative ribosome rescue factor ArfA n=1 Tax=Colwellia sp. Bg11-12 TaxID=2759817 RepID=UPI0015F3A184|nr:alternative ribosome rescue factor ArfA [Colwellia sp. Bg11-12]MBA6263355.1 ribosome alternative rescue factor ArfA [Colwellia sp. Bg11-12]